MEFDITNVEQQSVAWLRTGNQSTHYLEEIFVNQEL